MQKLKLLIAGCLFSSLFGGSWYINEKIKREYVDTLTFDNSAIELTNAETPIDYLTEDGNVFEKFKPREYVRVVTR